MHIVVDGYNVIHAWNQRAKLLRSGELEVAREQLIHSLSIYAAESGDQVTVVFDSRRGSSHSEMQAGVEVIYSGDRSSADHVIERLAFAAKTEGQTGSMQVVTGDRLHGQMVRAMGVGVLSPQDFRLLTQRAAEQTSGKQENMHHEAGESRRLQDRLSPDDRAKLERIWRGEE